MHSQVTLHGLSERASDCSPSCLPAAWAPHKARHTPSHLCTFSHGAPLPRAIPSPPSSPELFIFPNGPSRPLKHSLPLNPSPWQTRNLKVILICDKTAGCTSSAPQREAPARPLWGWGVGGYREQEGGRQGNASIWKEPPCPRPPPRGVQACWGLMGSPPAPREEPARGWGDRKHVSGPLLRPQYLLVPPSLFAPTPLCPASCRLPAAPPVAAPHSPAQRPRRFPSSVGFCGVVSLSSLGTPVLGVFNLLSSLPHILFSPVSPFL